ncbi:uncharacterized protein LOC130719471 [Lotus japonicus]|uniref:uncharacterized protein LOC130719471 n=1 Tax=Lotus japonicus TaxID=34305 RepID=UPI0025872D5D|nr:uncharacterized protein LOC130719471 [Lotus japonicus]
MEAKSHWTQHHEGGVVNTIDNWDIDEISSIGVGKVVKSIGYFKCLSLWYSHPSLSCGSIRPRNCDEEVRQFCTDVKGHSKVHVYVEHIVETSSFTVALLDIVDKAGESDVEIEIIETEKDNGSGVQVVPDFVTKKETDNVQGDPESEADAVAADKEEDKGVEGDDKGEEVEVDKEKDQTAEVDKEAVTENDTHVQDGSEVERDKTRQKKHTKKDASRRELKKYLRNDLNCCLWRAVRASIVPEWTVAMEAMKPLNEAAYLELKNLPPKQWVISAFSTDTHCDLQVNNMCEDFNMVILEHREKPIDDPGLDSHDDMRRENYKIEKESDESRMCVMDGRCVALLYEEKRKKLKTTHRKSTYMETYSYLIGPNNGPKLWGEDHSLPLNPPFMRRDVGRPKTYRSKKNDEPKDPNKMRLRKHHKNVKCRRCGKFGHNKRTCTRKTAENIAIPVGGNKDNTQLLHPEQRNEVGSSTATKILVGSQAPQSQTGTESQPPSSQSQPPSPQVLPPSSQGHTPPSQTQPPQRKPRVTKPKPKPKTQGKPNKAATRGKKNIGESSGTK